MKKSEPKGDEVSLELVERALGPLVPTTEAEVERAEADGVEHVGELPPSLRALREPARIEAPRSARVVSLDDVRSLRGGSGTPARGSSWLSHGAAAAAGALAAAAAIALGLRGPATNVGPAGGDVAASGSASAAPPSEPAKIALNDAGLCGAECCGGAECAKSPADMRACPSGRTCISCSRSELTDSQYRFKLGGLAPTELGKKALASGPLEVCVRAAASDRVCAPAHSSDDAARRWIELPLVTTAGDNLAGVTVEIRFVGAKQRLASWSQGIPVNAAVLCKGTMIEAKTDEGEVFGSMSMFLIDSHYVELGRGADVAGLEALARRFETPLELRVFETRQPGDRRFALAMGPFAKPRAERLRWAVLDRGAAAESHTGADYVGEPRPSP
ncbi:MAG: hypothetical protein IPM79_05100 [Polyangiaceae bacterium]|jgi:hypothetical protein|nr:hypothetical protein [Polyangiaceae bacterium]